MHTINLDFEQFRRLYLCVMQCIWSPASHPLKPINPAPTQGGPALVLVKLGSCKCILVRRIRLFPMHFFFVQNFSVLIVKFYKLSVLQEEWFYMKSLQIFILQNLISFHH